MRRRLRIAQLTTIASISVSLAGCYAHYSWLAVDATQTSADDRGTSTSTFSDREVTAAVQVAAEIARAVGLEISPMDGIRPTQPTRYNPFRELALYQGTGDNQGLLLTIAIKDDGSVIRLWISDLQHGDATDLVQELVRRLGPALKQAFPNRRVNYGEGRKLRIYGG